MDQQELITLPSGLAYQDLEVGTGEMVKNGDIVIAHYTGMLEDGKVFDSSKGGDPFATEIGVGQVIKGWDEGIPGMKAGGRRKLIIPAHLAYGEMALPGIPANSTLVFEVEVVEVMQPE
jgi:FKBP-type peptidyl-prolyl cis-trans isomerase